MASSPGSSEEKDTSYKVKPGTVDEGKDYEKINIANLTLRLLANDKIKNFQIASNHEEYGSLDDIVLEIQWNDGKETVYAIQLKHVTNKNNKRAFSISSLQEKKSKFSIPKYFESWKTKLKGKDCNMILFTNLKCDVAEKNVHLENTKAQIINDEGDHDNLLNTAKEENWCFKLELSSDYQDSITTETLEDYKHFFQHFYIYSNQANCSNVKKDAIGMFETLFGGNKNQFEIYLSFFISEWLNRTGNKKKLDMSWVKRSIALCLLNTDLIVPISINHSDNKNSQLLQEAISKFNVTVVQEEMRTKMAEVWGGSLSKLDSAETANRIKKENCLTNIGFVQKIEDLKDYEMAIILWMMGECPLIVLDHHTTRSVIELLPQYRFVLIEQDFSNLVLQAPTTIFRQLSDLEKYKEIYVKIVENYYCSVQGKETVNLKYLIKEHEQLSSTITPNVLMEMMNESRIIGENLEELPKPHIIRKLSITVIGLQFLEQIDKEDQKILIVLSLNKNVKIKKKLRNFNLIKVEDFLKSTTKPTNDKCLMYYTEEECLQTDFNEICARNKNVKQCHHFRVTNDDNLEWIKTKGNIDELETFKTESLSVDESELYTGQPANNVNIICANPGMGKSTMTKNLKNKLSSKFWTIIVRPTDISAYFRDKNNTNFIEHMEKKVSKKLQEFDIAVMHSFKKKNQMAFIWDGLDEISDYHFNKVMKIIDELSKKSFLQWITSRCHLQERLEKKFQVFARTIQQFDDDQQDEYIKRRLDETNSDTIEETIIKIKNNIKMIQCHEVLGIPLQIYMLTELFRQNLPEYSKLLDDIFSLADLYHHFVDEKFNRYFKEKAEVKKANDSLRQILDSYKTSYLKKYEKSALKAQFEPEVYEKLDANCDAFLERIKSECDGLGLITDVSENMVPTFLHNSYGEYFVASYFFKNYKKIDGLKDILFRERYSNIRFLFDLLMAKDRPAHIAVLYKNLTILKNKEDQVDSRDRGGRTPLHLVCTWGQRYPLLGTKPSDEDDEFYVINDALGESVIDENKKYREIFSYLLQKCGYKEKDDLFKIDCLSYADSALCLHPFIEISKNEKLNFDNFNNFRDISSVMFYATRFDHFHLIDSIDDAPLIKTIKRGLTLLHLCAKNDSVKCLKKLLSLEKYKEIVNFGGTYDVAPIKSACKQGNKKILELLIDGGADLSDILSLMETACKNGHDEIVEYLINISQMDIKADYRRIFPLMQTACRKGYHKIVEFLTKFDVDVNINIGKNLTPLFIASQYGHDKTVEVLIRSNADINKANKFGSTPLHIACQGNHIDIVRLLVDGNADINSTDNKGLTPLHVVCKNGYHEIVQLLIGCDQINVDVTSKKEKRTALFLACLCGDEKIVELLVNAGADINHSSNDGSTPIHVACKEGRVSVVKMLTKLGVNVNVPNGKNQHPLDLAETRDLQEIVDILKEVGAEKFGLEETEASF